MQQYPMEKQYWEKSNTERTEDVFEKEVNKLKAKLENNDGGLPLAPKEKDRINRYLNSQLGRIRQSGKIDAQLERFRRKSSSMKERELRWENHYSKRLGENLRRIGKPQPDKKCQPHAIIAGKDPEAGYMRAMLAVVGIRVDDPYNGVWLPAYEDCMPHWAFPNAVAHAWLNHPGYHKWLSDDKFFNFIDILSPDDKSRNAIIAILKNISILLQLERHSVPAKAIKMKKNTKVARG